MNEIHIVDVFTQKPYGGNPAAVMIVEEFRSDLAGIAAEMNLSEMAFVKPLENHQFFIRWFNLAGEMKTGGHSTLAAAHVLFQKNQIQDEQISFDSPNGAITIRRDEGEFIFDFPLVKISNMLEKSLFENVFGIAGDIIEVAQSAEDVIVAFRNETNIRTIVPNFSKIIGINARGVIVTAPSSNPKYDFVTRLFPPRGNISDDVATPSAFCKLADYWSRCMKKNELYGAQASQRGGSMRIKIENERVFLKGHAITMMTGTWLI